VLHVPPARDFSLPDRTAEAQINDIFSHADKHADKHNQLIKQKQARAKRKTQLRLLARQQVKQTKALTKVPCFADLGSTALSTVVDNMRYQKYKRGRNLCNQGEPSDKLFVLVKGVCGVHIQAKAEWQRDEAWVRVGELKEMDICGESALAIGSGEGNQAELRSATVTAETEDVETLELDRRAFFSLVSEGVIHTSVLARVSTIRQSRNQSNQRSASYMSEAGRLRSATKTRLAPVSKMSVIHNLGLSRQQTQRQKQNWQAEWKQRLDTFSIGDFRFGWRCLEAPEDRMMRSRYVNEKYSWMRKHEAKTRDSQHSNFAFN
jgi:CRP-like cAMP-binding protein